MYLMRKLLVLTGMFLAVSACKKENETNVAQASVPEVEVIKLQPQDVPLSFEFAANPLFCLLSVPIITI